MSYNYSYLITVEYLGFRWHGWQKQPDLKTVHWAIDKTLNFIAKGVKKKSIGVGRTDAKVSSKGFCFQMFIDEKINEEEFLQLFNKNLPSDIRASKIKPITDKNFNIIQHPKVKEYRYYFSVGTKNHPYAAPFITGYLDDLNIETMKAAARLFEGEHDFTHYCKRPNEATKVVRSVLCCKIVENTDLKASFFPDKSYVLIVKGEGFLRNQIRLMMGALEKVGQGEYSLDLIKESLEFNNALKLAKVVAPASGLHLHNIEFKE